MSPFMIMASLHLWLQKSSESPVNWPSDPIPLNYSTLNYYLTLEHLVDINPNALPQNLFGNLIRLLVFLKLCALRIPPVPIAAPMCMLLPSTTSNCQLRVAFYSLLFFHAEKLIGFVEVLQEHFERRAGDLLGAYRFSEA